LEEIYLRPERASEEGMRRRGEKEGQVRGGRGGGERGTSWEYVSNSFFLLTFHRLDNERANDLRHERGTERSRERQRQIQ
jgi:hypothetical protein